MRVMDENLLGPVREAEGNERKRGRWRSFLGFGRPKLKNQMIAIHVSFIRPLVALPPPDPRVQPHVGSPDVLISFSWGCQRSVSLVGTPMKEMDIG